ncbi:hypothetical protein MNBD_GAMMA23-335 [hydrothermal vent metagenome]|uniref:Glycosyltransferase 2-like domain-containing protein n=1 Tax=hydrothermal vent metagenome TaxID=652676 RepID=A0A3B1A3K7_9ZZZZ
MNVKTKFSIIMANYNNGEYIGDAVNSILSQTHADWELLICDDASTDNSVSKISKFLNDPRIKLFRNKVNKGIIHSENSLIKQCRSKYIGILDSDDVLTSDAVSTMLDAHISNPDTAFIYSQYEFCDSNLKFTSKGSSRAVPLNSSTLVDDCAVAFRTFKKSAALEIGLLDYAMKYAEDKDFIYKLEELAPIVFVDKVLYKYRIQDESSSHGDNEARARMIMSYARLEAYKRRLNTPISNLSKTSVGIEVMYGIGVSLRKLNFAQFKIFSLALRDYDLNMVKNMGAFVRGIRGKMLWL